jgi:hypothetical protein
MKVGQVYRGKSKNSILFIPLSEPDLDGNTLQLIVFAGSTKSINKVNQNGFDVPDITTTKKAIDANYPDLTFGYSKLENVESTYVPSTELPLSIGDKYQYIGKPAEYTVVTFFDRLKTANATSKIPYPFGVNLADVIAFVDGIINSKTGITPYLVGNGLITDDFRARLKSILLGNNNVNAELAYWSISEPKLAKVLYLKQSKPKKSITLQVKQKTKMATVTAGDIIADSMIVYPTSYAGLINFKTYPVNVRSGSLLLDKFRLTTAGTSYATNRTYAEITVLQLVSVQKLFDNAGVISGFIALEAIGDKVNNDIFGQSLRVITSNFYQVGDIDRYTELTTNINAGATPYKIDFRNSSNLTDPNNLVILNPVMMYLGGGQFTDVQGGTGKYGVGDEFSIFDSDEIAYMVGRRDQEWTILYSRLTLNKKGGFEVVYHCIGMTYLRQACDDYNFSKPFNSSVKVQYFDILESTLDAKFASGTYGNFKSYREDREAIANSYLQGSLSNTPKPSKPQIDEFAELKAILGNDFDDDFLAVVSGLDWGKIDKLRQKDPNALNTIKDLVQQIYVEYLLEKDFAVEPKAVQNTDGVKTKGYYLGNNEEIIKKRLEALGDIDEEFINNTNGKSTDDPNFPSMTFQEFGRFFYDIVGDANLPTQLIYNGDSGTGNLAISKGIEPAVNIQMQWNRYTSDGDVQLTAFGKNFGFGRTMGKGAGNLYEWGNVINYPLKYYAAWVMYNIAVYLIDGDFSEGLLFRGSAAKAKKSLPFKVTPWWLGQLRYFNSLGLFPTIDGAVDYICEIQQKSLAELPDNAQRQYFIEVNTPTAKSMFYSASLSKTDSQDKFSNVYVDRNIDKHLFENDAKVFKENLAKVDVDWGNPNAVYQPFTIGTPQVVKPKQTRQPKKPKLKFDTWQEPPTSFKELIGTAYNLVGELWLDYFDKEGERYVFVNFVAVRDGNSVAEPRSWMQQDVNLLWPQLDFKNESEALIAEYQDEFSKQEIDLYEKINYPVGNIVFRLAMNMSPQGTDFVAKFRNILEERIERNKKAVTPEVPKDFIQWGKSDSYAISGDMLRDQLMRAYETDGIDLYNTRFTYKNDTYTYFSLFYQPRLVSNVTEVNASKDLQAYAMIAGYSQLSTSFTTDYEKIFADELTKGANSLNRNFRTYGVVVPVSEENRFIDGYYDYLKAQAAQRVVPPTPPVQPTPPEPTKPIEPTTPEPPKPKVKKAVKPPVTKVEKLSKKYEDFDLDF